MTMLFANNATTTLAVGISNSALSLIVAAGQGDQFPSPSGSDYFYVTITNSGGLFEIVKCTSRSGDQLVIQRAQDGTYAYAWDAGSLVELRVVKANLDGFYQGSPVPSGVIALWSGSVGTIPSGWYLCNGANGTPDLRDRFVVGAASTYSVGATGGSADAIVVSHTHAATVTDPGHLHTYNPIFGTGGTSSNVANGSTSSIPYAPPAQSTNTATTGISVTNASTGVSATNANLPPYYALAYIMKA
jgi:hypothetical protein